MQDTLMILGASYNQIPMIKTAKSMGLRVIAVDGQVNAPGFAISDESHVVDVMAEDEVLKIAGEAGISGITTMVSNLGMRTVAYVAENLGLPGISREAAECSTDKLGIKRALEAASVSFPRGLSCSKPEQALKVLKTFRLPAVVKPRDGTKSQGISVIREALSAEEAILNAFRCSPEDKVMIEEWISGPTVGAECLIVEGRVIPILLTDKFNTRPPRCVTLGLTTPSCLDKHIRESVSSTAEAVGRALGLSMGAAHIDMIVDNGTPRVIDVGPRLAGGPVTFEFAPRLVGVDMVKCVIQMALGQKPTIEPKWNGKFGASRFLTVGERGCMHRITFSGVHRQFSFYPYLTLGQPVGPPKSDNDRLGCISIVGDTYEGTRREADKLLSSIEVDVAS